MSSPLAKPSPVRRGTLNFGLRRKSSAASLTPSHHSSSSPPNANGVNGTNGVTNGHTEEPSTADDNASVSSKTDKRPPKKRMFSILAPRGSKSSMNPDGGPANGHAGEPSELSENGSSDHGSSGLARSSIGSGFFSSQRRGSSERKQAAELAQEKEKLEEQVKALTTDKTALETALETEKAETKRLTEEVESQREKIREEVGAELVERQGEVASLNATVAELKGELEKTKASEQDLASYKEAAEAKLVEHEVRIRESVKGEKEALETKLEGVRKTIELKDLTIEKMIAEAAELQTQLDTALAEAKKLKEEKEAWMKKETDLQTEMGKIKGAGGCSIM